MFWRVPVDFRLSRLLATGWLLLLIAGGCEESTKSQSKPLIAAGSDAEFAVPDGTPKQILTFINDLRTRPTQAASAKDGVIRVRKIHEAMIVAGDKILAQRTNDQMLRQAATIKLMGTLQQAALYDRNSAKFDEMAKRSLAAVTQLQQDRRPVVAAVADEFSIAARGLNLHHLSENERTTLASDAIKYVETSRYSNDSIGDVAFLATEFSKEGDNKSAADLNDRLAEQLEKSIDRRVKMQIPGYRNMAKRYRMPGQPLQLEGKLLNGGSLDWSAYRGKVVLVDFWATWCKPCLMELPNVKAAYQKYHAKGFEVVAVSRDHDRRALENLVRSEVLPWDQMFDEELQQQKRQDNPMFVRYGISTIPTAILVDQQGIVVSVNARGQELKRLLAELFDQ